MRLIQDSATIIVLGNKYNRAIYDVKKMVNLFEPYFVTDEEDNLDNLKEADSLNQIKNNSQLLAGRKLRHKKRYHKKH